MSNDLNQQGPRIAISGKSGCGNTTVSSLVARSLGVRLVNYTFRNLALDEGVTFEEFCLMAEQDSKWDYLVDERQIALANEEPCVLGSRLAVWLWKEAQLTVYLKASVEVRAQRIHRREGGDLARVLEKTISRDQRDHDRYERLYGIDNDQFDFVDLVIDVENLGPEAIAERIIATWKQTIFTKSGE